MVKTIADKNKRTAKEIKIGFQTDVGREIIPEMLVMKLKRYKRYKIQFLIFMLLRLYSYRGNGLLFRIPYISLI